MLQLHAQNLLHPTPISSLIESASAFNDGWAIQAARFR
jgi:hypothetical protein